LQVADCRALQIWDIYGPQRRRCGQLALGHDAGLDVWIAWNLWLGEGARGKGLMRTFIKDKLLIIYKKMGSPPDGNTSAEACRMWEKLGAKKVPTNQNVKGYFYVLTD
jgi:hypothetical protein